MLPTTERSPVLRSLLAVLGTGAAISLFAGCGDGGIGKSFSLQASSPVTLVAGSYVDVDIDAQCDGSIPVDLVWVDAALNTIPLPKVEGGVVLPVAGRLNCVAPGDDQLGSGVRTLRFYAVDGASPGRRTFILKGTGIHDSETLEVLIDVTAPVDPGFSLAAPQQVGLAPGGSSVDVAVTVVRTGLAGAIALSWQPLTLTDGLTAGTEGGVRVVAPVADGSTAASMRIEGTGVAEMIVNGALSTILLRAHGGTTDRAVLVQLLPAVDPPTVPTGFRATPDVTVDRARLGRGRQRAHLQARTRGGGRRMGRGRRRYSWDGHRLQRHGPCSRHTVLLSPLRHQRQRHQPVRHAQRPAPFPRRPLPATRGGTRSAPPCHPAMTSSPSHPC